MPRLLRQLPCPAPARPHRSAPAPALPGPRATGGARHAGSADCTGTTTGNSAGADTGRGR